MPPTATGIRARNRAAIEEEILAVARRRLAEDGAAALSLRAVARELGMASSAVYRYVASRDELLTRLIVEAYDSLGDAVDATLEGVEEPLERFRVIARALRAWSARHPHQFALLYGSPVPGYHAPASRTTAPGTRVTDHLVEVIVALGKGRACPPDPRAETALAGMLAELPVGEEVPPAGPRSPGARSGVPAGLVSRGLAAWTLVLGTVTAERFEQLGPDAVSDPTAHFENMLDLAVGLVS